MSINLDSVELDARKAAEDEVAQLLRNPADLKRLQSFRDDQAAKQALSSTISNQVESIGGGLELLNRAQKAIVRVQQAFAHINRLCAECNNVIQHNDKIQALASVHYHISKTLQYAAHVRELPDQAREAEVLLNDDAQLLQVYEMLSILECTSIKTKMALEAGAKASVSQSSALNEYFNKVQASITRFEERLWSIIRNFMTISQERQWLLTDAVRIIETQERVDQHIRSAAEVGLAPVVKPRHYRQTAEHHLGLHLDEKFAPLQQRCSILAAAGENTKERVMAILDEASGYVAELSVVYDKVAPCFPPHYKIFDVLRKEYHRQIAAMLDVIGMCADYLSNSDILDVIGWVERYLATLENLGVDDKEAALPDSPTSGMVLLIAKYMERTRMILRQWYTNILQIDMESEPKEHANGHAYTPGVTELFRAWNEQLALLEPISRGDFLLKMAQVLLETMTEYQRRQEQYLDEMAMEHEGDMFRVCAVANNGARCFVLAGDFKEDIHKMLEEEYKGQLLMEKEIHGFIGVANYAMQRLLDGMFRIPDFLVLFEQLYASEAYFSRDVTGSVIATVQQYLFENCEYWMDKHNFEHLCLLTMIKTVQHYLAGALQNIRNVTRAVMQGMAADIEDIDRFFVNFVDAETVAKHVQPLVDLRAMFAADSADAYLLAYSSLLQACPGISPAILEKLIHARSDLGKSEVRQIMEQCREVYIDRQRLLTVEEAARLKPSGKETGFARVLIAARRS